MTKTVKVGMLGLGTVGGGVFKVLRNFDNIEIKKIAVNNINKDRNIEGLNKDILTANPDEIVNDKEISILIEVIGGIEPAYSLIKQAIANKKHIITANKELIAKYGKELFNLAKENNVVILYEAAVAGGIPIIMPIKTSLAANKFSNVAAILNGTTNYILTKMEKDGADFASVLKEAQELGYAEADPTNDVQGYDAAYKICILATIIFNKRCDVNKIFIEGIDKITPVDIEYARDLGYKIKLIALARESKGGKIDVRVHPMLVPLSQPLAHINNVLNAVVLNGHPVGQVMFSGPGAGEFPTASSVVGDILSLVQEIKYTDYPLPMMRCRHDETAVHLDIEETTNKYYISVNTANTPGVLGELGQIFGRNNINLTSIIQKGILEDGSARIVLLTEDALEKNVNKAINEITKLGVTKKILNILRVMD